MYIYCLLLSIRASPTHTLLLESVLSLSACLLPFSTHPDLEDFHQHVEENLGEISPAYTGSILYTPELQSFCQAQVQKYTEWILCETETRDL